MAIREATPQAAPLPDGADFVTNDFSIVVATENGTGSQTANLAIMRAIFKMGIPVNGKNIFPSNIQGLPTWYHIRVSGEGYVARRATSEVLIAFNQATAIEDLQNLPSGGACIYRDDLKGLPTRDDVSMYPVPVNKLLKQIGAKGQFKDRYTNMLYVGITAWLLNIDMTKVDLALEIHFKRRRKLVDMNMDVIRLCYDWSAENLTKTDRFVVEALDKTDGQILMTGNDAAGLGSVFGGLTVCTWYPITPSTSMIDAVNSYLPRLRVDDESGKATFAVLQAEDELAAIGMVLGAGWAGARSMTATSGPGLSLMTEFVGLGYFAEIPGVIWDIQRVGPSTGLPTRTGQGDIIPAYYCGHGDTKNIVLLPGTIHECFQMGTTSLNLAEQFQTVIFVLSDLDLGMNTWMSEAFDYPEEPITRGKVLTAQEVEEKGFARYKDIDGDGIGYRTLPGTQSTKAAYFTRGTGRNSAAVYSERAEDWLETMDRLMRKFDTARDVVPAPIVDEVEDSKYAILSFGSTMYAIEEARDWLAEAGIKTSFMRLKALPISNTVREFVAKYDRVYVVEMNRDGQMHTILRDEMPEMNMKMLSIAHQDGMPLTARFLVDRLNEMEAANND